MLFHTWVFAVFFVIVYAVYLPLRGTRWYRPWLLVASYVFYGWWNPLYLALILYSTAADYVAVVLMERSRHRKAWLVASIVNNLLKLGFFKYAGFVTDNLNALLHAAGIGYAIPAPDFLLPVGISFYTFQSMSYTIDFYRGDIPRERSFVRFATYVSLFPQLVAGPIERARNLLPQLRSKPRITARHITDGLSLLAVGLFKKLAIADYLAMYVKRVYETARVAPEQVDATSAIVATVAFGWVIYCDFSGYTDMARGIARMMGFDLMQNFNRPYLATSLGDFWRRWHISLSTWFRDYVYIPLGGNRKGAAATYLFMTITMLTSALWHGAAWTFLVWGALHAVGRIATRELERTTFYSQRVPTLVKQLLVFVFVSFTWIFFAAKDVGHALTICERIVIGGFGDPRFPVLGFVLIGGLWLYEYVCESRLRWVLELGCVRVVLMAAMLVVLVLFGSSDQQPFIYFQF